MENLYNSLFSFNYKGIATAFAADVGGVFDSPGFVKYFMIFKFIVAIFSILMFIVIIRTLFKITGSSKVVKKEKSAMIDIKKNELTEKWESAIKKSQSSSESDWKLAIIEVDKLFDYSMRLMGYKGDTMGERLKQLNRSQFPTVNSIWEAHKLRNRIVHNPHQEISKKDLDFVIRIYERVFGDLNVI